MNTITLAEKLAYCLDNDLFEEAKSLFDGRCKYRSPGGLIEGPEAILSSYRQHSEYAHSTFDKVIYESSIQDLGNRLFEITYRDIILKAGELHTYKCIQLVQFNLEGLVSEIEHVEIAEELAGLMAFYRRAGIQ